MSTSTAILLVPSHHPTPPVVKDAVAALVARAQGGDVQAFEELYRSTAGRIYSLCLRMTSDSQHAQELAHDAFVQAWETLGSFRGQSSFESWLHRLTVNTVLQDVRSAKRRSARVRLSGDEAHEVDAAVEELDTIGKLDIQDALAKLSTEARRVVVLHDIEGYRHDEIAKLLGVASGTVRARLHHARRQLKEWMTR